MKAVTHVTIGLLVGSQAGDRQVLTRYNLVDKMLVENAAFKLGLSTADFIRTVSIGAAVEVMRELNEPEPEAIAVPVVDKVETKPKRLNLSKHRAPGE